MLKNRRVVCRIVAVAGAWVLSGAVATAQKFDAVHWKSHVEMEGGQQGGRVPADYEIWMKRGNMRMKANSAGMSMNMLKRGDDLYTWTEGQGAGMKMNATSQPSKGPSSDYVNRIEQFRTKGRKVGNEKIDGHPCEIWEYTDEHGSHGRYWLAQDLKDFPVKAVIDSAGTKTTYHNTDIQVAATIPDSMMAVPSNVEFQDMSEMMKRMQPNR
jgi:hypothetical protein